MAWQRQRAGGGYPFWFARLDGEGARLGDELLLADVPAWRTPAQIVWTGDDYGLAWGDSREGFGEAGYDAPWQLYFVRVSSAGQKLGEELPLTEPGVSYYPMALAWTGQQYFVAYKTLDDDSTVFLLRLDPEGQPVGEPVELSRASPWAAHAVWTGEELGVVWAEPQGDDLELRLARVSEDGVRLAPDLPVAVLGGAMRGLTVDWIGGRYGVVWATEQEEQTDFYLATVTDAPGNGRSPPLSQACYTAAPATRAIGLCRPGRHACSV